MGGGASKRYQTSFPGSLPVWDEPAIIDLSLTPPRTPPKVNDDLALQSAGSQVERKSASRQYVGEDPMERIQWRGPGVIDGGPVTRSAASQPSPEPLQDDLFAPPPPFPETEVPVAARVVLMTWARWGRNSLRIRAEQQVKELQHQRFQRPSLSPQATPRGSPRSPTSRGSIPPAHTPSREAATPDSAAQSSRSQAASPSGFSRTPESQRGFVPRRGRQSTPPEGGGSFLDEMFQEQRRQMNAQGVKLQLQKTLPQTGDGGPSSSTQDAGTPGFGIGTPGFASSAQTSAYASATSTAQSSGRQTPLNRGQMSPWILQSQPNRASSSDDDCLEPGVAWEPDSLRLTLGAPTVREDRQQIMPSVREEEDSATLVYDELENATQVAQQVPVSSPVAQECLEEEPDKFLQYWSASRNDWLPAKLISQEGNGIFTIDKQMTGCLAKVHNSDLLWNSELCRDHVIRLLTTLEQSREEAPPPHVLHSHAEEDTVGSTLDTQASHRPGTIVRDDLSDDSDED